MSEKEEFEVLPAEMPKWIRDHVELYLSDPERAHLWDSTIGGGPGPLPTLLLIARGAKSGKLRPLPLLYQEMDGEVRRHRLQGRRADASGLVRESESESGVRDPRRSEPHAGSRADCKRRRTNTRLEEDGGDVSAV